MRVITRELNRYGLQDEFSRTVLGFMDTLPAFKRFLPDLPDGYSQGVLYYRFLGHSFEAHDALEDVNALQRLLHAAMIPFAILKEHTYTVKSVYDNVNFLERKNNRLSTLKPYLSGVVSSVMMGKIAASGLSYDHLRLAFDRGGGDGVRTLLRETYNGQPRVTNHQSVLKALVDHLSPS